MQRRPEVANSALKGRVKISTMNMTELNNFDIYTKNLSGLKFGTQYTSILVSPLFALWALVTNDGSTCDLYMIDLPSLMNIKSRERME